MAVDWFRLALLGAILLPGAAFVAYTKRHSALRVRVAWVAAYLVPVAAVTLAVMAGWSPVAAFGVGVVASAVASGVIWIAAR